MVKSSFHVSLKAQISPFQLGLTDQIILSIIKEGEHP